MKRKNSIIGVKKVASLDGDLQTFFVPGVGEVEARDLEDLKLKVKKTKPSKAEKVEDGDGNS